MMIHDCLRCARTPIGAAVLIALYGAPLAVDAQTQPDPKSQTLQEVVVTASRRSQTTEEVPYSLQVVSPTQLANSGATDLPALARQVPGVSMSDSGARNSANTFPIIRGLNASPGAGSFRTFEQAPVGTYIGNSPIDGYFQFNDIERIEVLRGPQGTLYGAGALGGALRIIPASPKLREFSGNVDMKGGMVDKASDPSYTTAAAINLPMGETFALRVAGNYDYEPGFVDAHGLMRLDGNGAPVRTNPADPNSTGEYYSKEDWNDQKTFTGRASLLWQPTETFNANLAYMYSHLEGNSGRTVNRTYPGGEFVGDPRITFPAGGDNTRFSAVEEPFTRKTDLASLDLSYDAGFATLSATSSYFTTEGDTTFDSSYVLYRIPQYLGYYVGSTLNPRFILPQVYGDKSHTFTQEVRLVSNTEPGKKFDYVAGIFYEKQERIGSWLVSIPGSPERATELGCTGIWFPGATFPDCNVLIGPNDVNVDQHDKQTFEDKSIFGELTWHFTEHGDLTVGVRHFEQDFEDVQSLELYSFGLSVPEEPRTSKASKTKWKVNPSYEYATNHRVYALWSQGFRRGGSNAIPLVGPFGDNPALITYKPDEADNYEIGLKGHFANGLSYTVDVFKIYWDNPQIGGTTPTTNFAVWNADEAISKGFELDLNMPFGDTGLSLSLSGAYSDAAFSKDYTVPSTFGDIVGFKGQQLPGSPKESGAATLNYERDVFSNFRLSASLNDTYRSEVVLSNFGILGQAPLTADKLNLLNASLALSRDNWLVGLYATNLTNERVLLSPGNPDPSTDNLSTSSLINQPREVSLRLNYSF
ncbi:MAG TPA: TonB-dependent receptor [Steroidobacteraceae bacterium]|jgi:outer membrane receptor protein involved in Fe transport|nr:TonB-dependent receptor [Steroidobacteraceae bacterium]